MDVLKRLQTKSGAIQCIDMHTSGEPTRLILSEYPELTGTLLEQRAQARSQYDDLRKGLMLEPRGHSDMYGALIRPMTELTRTGKADVGVLFFTNDGYSTMCGHATLALGRFLLDTHDESIFPRRGLVTIDRESHAAALRLHTPCGVVQVTVPLSLDNCRSDPTKRVSFVSVPSYATGIHVRVSIGQEYRWPELGKREYIHADFSYGGAFFCIVAAHELGFPQGLKQIDLRAADTATRRLKAAINADPSLKYLFRHPDSPDLSFLYSIMLVDRELGKPLAGSDEAETGLCYFADQQVDRSPTGSAVAARVALSFAKSDLVFGKKRTYHSFTSALTNEHGFLGSLHEECGKLDDFPIVRVQVAGLAYYTGVHTFVAEAADPIGSDGFAFAGLVP